MRNRGVKRYSALDLEHVSEEACALGLYKAIHEIKPQNTLRITVLTRCTKNLHHSFGAKSRNFVQWNLLGLHADVEDVQAAVAAAAKGEVLSPPFALLDHAAETVVQPCEVFGTKVNLYAARWLLGRCLDKGLTKQLDRFDQSMAVRQVSQLATRCLLLPKTLSSPLSTVPRARHRHFPRHFPEGRKTHNERDLFLGKNRPAEVELLYIGQYASVEVERGRRKRRVGQIGQGSQSQRSYRARKSGEIWSEQELEVTAKGEVLESRSVVQDEASQRKDAFLTAVGARR